MFRNVLEAMEFIRENDIRMFHWIREHGFIPVIIATKSDKLSKGAIPKQLKLIRETLEAPKDITMIPFSSQTKAGREEVWELIEHLLQAMSLS